MSARATAASVVGSAVILVIAWQLGLAATNPPSPGTPGSFADGTFTGNSTGTRFGNVQVQVIISGGRIRDVTALHLTDNDSRSVSISNRAAPILRTEVLSAQSANIQNVSGATYTSNAYRTSLQSALDLAAV